MFLTVGGIGLFGCGLEHARYARSSRLRGLAAWTHQAENAAKAVESKLSS